MNAKKKLLGALVGVSWMFCCAYAGNSFPVQIDLKESPLHGDTVQQARQKEFVTKLKGLFEAPEFQQKVSQLIREEAKGSPYMEHPHQILPKVNVSFFAAPFKKNGSLVHLFFSWPGLPIEGNAGTLKSQDDEEKNVSDEELKKQMLEAVRGEVRRLLKHRPHPKQKEPPTIEMPTLAESPVPRAEEAQDSPI